MRFEELRGFKCKGDVVWETGRCGEVRQFGVGRSVLELSGFGWWD